MKASDIFTPGTLPIVTYYDRSNLLLEEALRDALDTKGLICSISGPSKCGKTVLCEKVLEKENLILITGAGIDSIDRFWEKLRQELDISKIITEFNERTITGTVAGKIEAGGGIPMLANIKGEFSGQSSAEKKNNISKIFDEKNSKALFKLLRDNEISLVVDDFHYADQKIQVTLAHEFKEAAREGTRIIVISVSHRSDQAIRVNPDLYSSRSEMRIKA